MMSLPIVEREIRVQSRRGVTRWARWGVALFACLLSIQILLSSSAFNSISVSGQWTYEFLVGVGVFLAAVAGVVSADAISSERREGTLGFLFLTDLSGYDVVLGKLAACGLLTLYALLALSPALALPLLAGGVTLSEVFRATLAILNVLFASLVIGLFASTLARTRHRAQRNAILLTAAVLLLPLILGRISFGVFSLAMLSPLRAIFSSSEMKYGIERSAYWIALAVSHGGCWILLWLTARAISSNWREVANEAEQGKTKRIKRRGKIFDGSEPIFWRAYHLPGQRLLVWTAVLLRVFGWILWWIVWGFAGASILMGGFVRGGFSVAPFIAGGIIAWTAGRFFEEARRTGELELLLSTPVTGREIVFGQWRALWRHLRWPLVFLIFFEVVPSLLFGYGFAQGVGLQLAAAGLRAASIIAEIAALIWVGMWFGLRLRRPWMSVLSTVATVKVVPWLISWITNIFFVWNGGLAGTGVRTFLMVGLAACSFSISFFLILWARRRLFHHLSNGRGGVPQSNETLGFMSWLRRVRHWTPT